MPSDDLAPARGIRNAVLPSLALWAAIIGVGLLTCSATNAQTLSPNSTANSTANAGAISGSQSGAQAGSGSVSSIQQTFTGPETQRQSITYGGGTRNEIVNSGTVRNDINYSGGTASTVNQNTRVEGTQTLRNVPTVYAPSFGGTNPCTVSASAGGAGAGIGITIGGSWSDPACERRNLAVIAVQALNDPALAREILCGTADYRSARQRIGQPCAMDIPPGGAPVQVAAAPAPIQIAAPAAPVTVTFPAWCATVGAGDPIESKRACGLEADISRARRR